MQVGFENLCDGGCTRPIPTWDPWELQRLGWRIDGTMPEAEYHPPHSEKHPHLVQGYTEWKDAPDTKYVCPICVEKEQTV